MPDQVPDALTARLRVGLRSAWRFLVVSVRLLPLLLALARDRRRYLLLGPPREVTSATRTRRAEFLLGAFLDLGPTFVKLGQLLSTRPDSVPPEYVDVLSTLQDEVPPAPWPEARRVLEAELGPVVEAFDEFDPDPISGASLGQVYTATLDGHPVAVKVLRPGIRPRVEADLRVIRVVVTVVRWASPPAQASTFRGLFEEFAATIRQEMDYVHEAAMLREIGANFEDDDGVRIPAVVDRRSGSRVLTMEYVGGTKVTDGPDLQSLDLDRTALVRRLQGLYTRMILEDGVFHGDPHPGNIAVQDDGTVVLYDFGMCGRLDDDTRTHLASFYSGVASGDYDAVIDAFDAMGALAPGADRETLRELLAVAVEDLRGEDLDSVRVADVMARVDLYDFPLVLPRELALLVRVATVLDGVCRSIEPDADLVGMLESYLGME